MSYVQPYPASKLDAQYYYIGDNVRYNGHEWTVMDVSSLGGSLRYNLINDVGNEARWIATKHISLSSKGSHRTVVVGDYLVEEADIVPFLYQGRSMGLPVFVEKKPQLLLPDTGASRNVISSGRLKDYPQAVVASEELEEQRFAPVSLSGSVLRSEGHVVLECNFGNGVLEHLRFEVIDCARDLFLLGRDFVKRYSLFTSNWGWLQPLEDHDGIYQVNSLGSAASLLEVKLNSLTVKAYADTGCEVDLLSERFVAENRSYFQAISLDNSEYVTIEFPINGSNRDLEVLKTKVVVDVGISRGRYDTTEGPAYKNMTRDASGPGGSDKIEPGPTELSRSRTFYISQKSQRDVVLSQAFLHSMDAHRRFPKSFSEIHEVVCSLQPVYKEKSRPLPPTTPSKWPSCFWMQDLDRSNKTEANLETATKQFQDKRREWLQVGTSMGKQIDELRQKRAKAIEASLSTQRLDVDIAAKEQERIDVRRTFQAQLKTLQALIETYKVA